MINISDLKMITKESSKGNQFKFHINSTWYKADQFGYEGLAEAISTNILRFSNIYRFCEYSLEEIKYKDQEYTGCKSKDFLYPGETLISLEKIGRLYKNTSIGLFLSGHAMTEDKIQSTLSFLHSLRIPKIDSYITALIEFDALILNEDRHTNNICFIRRGESLYPAPVFDNGCSLLSNIGEHSLSRNVEYHIRQATAKPFSTSFDVQKRLLEKENGVVFQTSYNKDQLRKTLDASAGTYSDDILSRVEKVVCLQLERYPELQYQKERDELDR